MTDEERAEIADLAMRALDILLEEYGDDVELCAAGLVFEVKVTDDDGEPFYHANYKSLERNSPHHIGGLFQSTAAHILSPSSDVD